MSSRSTRGRTRREGSDIIIEPEGARRPSALVILAHGLGDSAQGWVDTAEQLARALPHVRFYLPTAPVMPVTINGGARCNSWYDIKSLSRHRELESCEGLHASRARVHALITSSGVPPSRVVLAGFSQGGALSLFAGLTWGKPLPAAGAAARAEVLASDGSATVAVGGAAGGGAAAVGGDAAAARGGALQPPPAEGAAEDEPEPLAGIAVMSGYMPLPAEAEPSRAVAEGTPVRFFHGDEDGVVPLDYGRDAERRTRGFGVKDVKFNVYEGMPHSACDEEIRDLLAFLRERLPAPSSA